MAKRAVIITSVPQTRGRIRRATTRELQVGSIESAIESYLQSGSGSDGNDGTSRPKR